MLELVNISFGGFNGRVKNKILDGISLKFKRGSFTVITGPNGSGKSSLAEVIMGIKKASSGQIVFDKTDITDKTITDRAKEGIAFSFQQPVKFKGVTVYDLLNISNGALMSETEAGRYLKKVGLEPENYLFREVDEKLSGGELKRIEIASVLARNAKLIIFDEPEAGIDIWSFEKLTSIFKKLKAEGRTLIVISHQEKIFKIADEIIMLEGGKVTARGTFKKVLLAAGEATK